MHILRTNIGIDGAVLAAAMQSGACKTKKDVVEAGLRLVARQAADRDILRWQGRLQRDGDDFSAELPPTALHTGTGAPASAPLQEPAAVAVRRRHAGR